MHHAQKGHMVHWTADGPKASSSSYLLYQGLDKLRAAVVKDMAQADHADKLWIQKPQKLSEKAASAKARGTYLLHRDIDKLEMACLGLAQLHATGSKTARPD